MNSGRSELAADVERELGALAQQMSALEQLPLLGVAASNDSGAGAFAAMLGLDTSSEEQQVEDRGVGLKRELASLLKRYPAELARTRTQIELRSDLASSTAAKVSSLQQALTALEPAVRAEQQRIQGEVR